MDLKNIQAAFDYLKANNLLNANYLEELFMIGKLIEDESVKTEVLDYMTQFADKGTLKVYLSNTKIPQNGNQKDLVKALVTIAKKSETLDIGKMFRLLTNGFRISLISGIETDGEEAPDEALRIFKGIVLGKELAQIPRFNGIKELTIFSDGFDVIPDEIGALTSLETLSIDHYGSQTLPASFANLVHLKELKLHITTLTEIPAFIRELPSLTALKIEGSHYSYSPTHFTIPEWIGQLPALKNLELAYIQEETLPENLFPPQLEAVYFAQMSHLKSIPASIEQCSNLKSFIIATSPQITQLPDGMKNLKELEELRLINMNGLTQLDGNLVYAPQIRALEISGSNAVISEPEKTINFSEELIIRNESYLKYVLENPDLFPEIKKLRISQIKKQSDFSAGIGGLKKLEQLEVIYSSGLDELLSDLGNCRHLEELEFMNSELERFPDLKELELKKITLWNCKNLFVSFEALPKKTDELHLFNVGMLDFEASVSKYIGRFKLENTGIVHFDAIGKHDCVQIKLFPGSANTIDGKPVIEQLPDFSAMKNLESFEIHGRIDHIGNCFTGLTELKLLRLEGMDFSTEKHALVSIPSDLLRDSNIETFQLTHYSGSNLDAILLAGKKLRSIELRSIHHMNYLPDLSLLSRLEHLGISHCDDFISLKNPLPEITSVTIEWCKNATIDLYEELASKKSLRKVQLRYLGDRFNYFPIKLDFLESLELQAIRIPEVPAAIENFQHLHTLGLDSSSIKTLPKEMASLSKLKRMAIDGVWFDELPLELAALDLEEVRMYFSKFAGNNMKREKYALLIGENCRIVRDFSTGEKTNRMNGYDERTNEAREARRKILGN
ncbi:hypothetical protein [Fluviicola sp.]|uniref:leucine-rich repeat domain-containing protein n=1 Tax=Fluviicola sp. TaxID=1917219 RepID=UPI0026247F3C|nr:hypothetical protein [Fluviicola sp.]